MRSKPALTCVAILCAAAALASVNMTSSVASAFPKPSLYPIAWEIDFKYETPKRIVVETPGGKDPKAYWYMTYVATNNTKEEQVFLPTFEMVTKDGKIVPANPAIAPAVFNAIARRERSRPLQPALKLEGQILVGEDQAKYGVAIWEEPNPEPGTFSIFVGGLSGELAPLTDDSGKPLTDKDGKPLVLRKTKQIDLTVRGDELYGNDPIINDGESWVMR